MQRIASLLAAAALAMMPAMALAHGPSPQKVIKEIVIQVEPAKAWEVVRDFGAIAHWHPDVVDARLEERPADDGVAAPHRLLTLRSGNTVVEMLRKVQDDAMKLDYKMVEGSLPVSGYRALMEVHPGANAGEARVIWTGRFYNKANALEAGPGEDNPAAVAAINALYDAGLAGLKRMLETR